MEQCGCPGERTEQRRPQRTRDCEGRSPLSEVYACKVLRNPGALGNVLGRSRCYQRWGRAQSAAGMGRHPAGCSQHTPETQAGRSTRGAGGKMAQGPTAACIRHTHTTTDSTLKNNTVSGMEDENKTIAEIKFLKIKCLICFKMQCWGLRPGPCTCQACYHPLVTPQPNTFTTWGGGGSTPGQGNGSV